MWTFHFDKVCVRGEFLLPPSVFVVLQMNKRILNVDNGPGSNGLRGGIKQYSARTTTGPWLDTYGGPLGYKRGFTTSDFQTEAQHAQLGAIGRPSGPFGAGIPVIDARDSRGNRLDSIGTQTWVSNTKATHPNFGVIRKVIHRIKTRYAIYVTTLTLYISHRSQEDTTYTLLKPRLSREKLLEYRQQWTVDNEASRNIRYQTESRIAGNAAAGKFLTHTLRILPGAPKSMETYRERLVERYGTFAMSALRLHIGTQSLSFKEFRARMQAVGVEIKPYELSQV